MANTKTKKDQKKEYVVIYQSQEHYEVLGYARAASLEEAKEKAQQIAGKLGLKLGKIIGYSEWYDNSVGPIYYEKSAAIGMGGGESAPTIPTGTKEVKLNVNVTYLLEE